MRENSLKMISLSRMLTLAGAISLIGVTLFVVPAEASNAPAGSPATGPAAVVILANGWINYNNTMTSTLPLSNLRTFTVYGQVNVSGDCVLTSVEPAIPSGDSAVVSETSYNPALCEATYAMGLASPQVASSLGVTPSSAQVPAPGSSSTSAPATQIALNEYNNKVYYKTEYIDPLFITITSLALNLSYNYNSNGFVGSASNASVGYRFAWDGWSGASPTATSFINGGNTAVGTGYYRSSNVDFQLYMDSTGLGLLCTGSLTAVFTQDMTIADAGAVGGATPPPASNANSDTATGGCSNLVHFGAEYGSGTIS